MGNIAGRTSMTSLHRIRISSYQRTVVKGQHFSAVFIPCLLAAEVPPGSCPCPECDWVLTCQVWLTHRGSGHLPYMAPPPASQGSLTSYITHTRIVVQWQPKTHIGVHLSWDSVNVHLSYLTICSYAIPFFRLLHIFVSWNLLCLNFVQQLLR